MNLYISEKGNDGDRTLAFYLISEHLITELGYNQRDYFHRNIEHVTAHEEIIMYRSLSKFTQLHSGPTRRYCQKGELVALFL